MLQYSWHICKNHSFFQKSPSNVSKTCFRTKDGRSKSRSKKWLPSGSNFFKASEYRCLASRWYCDLLAHHYITQNRWNSITQQDQFLYVWKRRLSPHKRIHVACSNQCSVRLGVWYGPDNVIQHSLAISPTYFQIIWSDTPVCHQMN